MIYDICMYDGYTYAVMHFESHVCKHFCNIFSLGFNFYWFSFVNTIQNGGGVILALFGAKMGSGALPITWCSEAAGDPFESIPLALEPSATRLSPDMQGKHQQK